MSAIGGDGGSPRASAAGCASAGGDERVERDLQAQDSPTIDVNKTASFRRLDHASLMMCRKSPGIGWA
eukprot:3188992-Rhodomonas_salina.2